MSPESGMSERLRSLESQVAADAVRHAAQDQRAVMLEGKIGRVADCVQRLTVQGERSSARLDSISAQMRWLMGLVAVGVAAAMKIALGW